MAQVIVYENGNAIGGEGHPTNASDITFDNTGTDLVSENVESAIKEVNSKKAEKLKLLWTNTSPTSNFASQSVQLSENSSGFDMFLTIIYTNTSATHTFSVIHGLKGIISQVIPTNNNVGARERTIEISGTTASIADAFTVTAGTTYSINNSTLIPYKIFGIKL